MKNEINNTSKPVEQSDEQSSEDNNSSTIQDNTTLMRRRSLLKGLGAVPLVMTLHSGAAMAAKSNDITACRGPQGNTPLECVKKKDLDNYVRADTGSAPEKFCLVNVDAEGNIIEDQPFNPDLVVTGSCWTSF